MSLIISKNGKNAKKVDRSVFTSEDELQQYIYDNPESIPLYDIKEDIRLLIVAREFPTQSGPIDAVGIDKDGELYLIETKLYRNADKRHVVAQVLDYGASLWRHYSDFAVFLGELERQSQKKWNMSFQKKLQDFFGASEEEVQTMINNFRGNLDEGTFKFVVLMDTLHSQLKDLILFLNQYSKFNLYVAEIEYYKFETYEIMIPKLFGAEVKKDISVSKPRSEARVWDEESFFAELRQNADEETCTKMEQIFDFVQQYGPMEYGVNSFKLKAESKDGLRKTVFFANTNGRWNIVPEVWKSNPELRKKYADMMVKTVTSLKRDRLDATYYEVRLLELAEEDIRKLLMIFGQMIGEIRKRGENIE
jgi:hypothetical protein